MRATVPSVLLLVLACCTCAPANAGQTHPMPSPEQVLAVPAMRESTVTRLTCLAEPYGIGYASLVSFPPCVTFDAPINALFGHALGGTSWAWAVWSLSGIPQDAQIIRAEVEHYLWPDGFNEPDLELRYAQLDSVPVPPPDDCNELWTDLQSGSVYTLVPMGQSDGLRRHELGGSATADIEQRLAERGLFAIAIQTDYLSIPMGFADLPGWSAGGVDLLVSWRDPSPAEAISWGQVKSLFRE